MKLLRIEIWDNNIEHKVNALVEIGEITLPIAAKERNFWADTMRDHIFLGHEVRVKLINQ